MKIENGQLKKLLAAANLNKAMLKEPASENWQAPHAGVKL
jgi:hypothetical protein